MKVNLKNEKPKKKREARVRIKIFLVCASVEASSWPSSKATKESLLLDYYHALLQRVELSSNARQSMEPRITSSKMQCHK